MQPLTASTIFLALLLAACGDSDAPSDSGGPDASDSGSADASDSGSTGFDGAFIEDTCGPADGSAVSITLYDSLTAACAADSTARTLVITVWGGTTFPIPPGTTVTSTAVDGGLGNGSATLCLGGTAPCLTSADFTVTFDEYVQDDSAAGSYSITFAGDRVESGTFDAPWCGGDALCG
ncbi:MAG: hypothetical protein DRJ42_14685 [Deltaproteobacteria bacterium]|nr:MAG: hypothetical protein DRJ42_14685 [Deltaproteobacteria bacterium]